MKKSKEKIGLAVIALTGFATISCGGIQSNESQASKSEQSSQTSEPSYRELTHKEASDVAAEITALLDDENSEQYKKFNGKRSVSVKYLSDDCNLVFDIDPEDGYYYFKIIAWYDDLQKYVTSTRWLNGNEENFSAGYTVHQSETLTSQEKWTYEGAKKYMDGWSNHFWNLSYHYPLDVLQESYLVETDEYEYEYMKKYNDGTYQYRGAHYGKGGYPSSCVYTITIGSNKLPISVKLERHVEDWDRVMEYDYNFDSDFQKVYPTLENEENLSYVNP